MSERGTGTPAAPGTRLAPAPPDLRLLPAPLDLRLLPAAAAAWGAAWWATGHASRAAEVLPGALVVVGVVLPALLVAGWVRGGGRRGGPGRGAPPGAVLAAAALASAVVVLVLVSTAAQEALARAGPVPRWAAEEQTVRVGLLVRSDPRRLPARQPGRPDGVLVLAHVERVEQVGRVEQAGRPGRPAGGRAAPAASPVLVLADPSWQGVRPGRRYEAVGRLRPAEPGGRAVAVLRARPHPAPRGPAGPVHEAAERLREGLRAASAGLPPDAGGLLPALVVGDTSVLPAGLEDDMRSVGLAHLTAVSGSNTTLVCGAALLAASAVGLGRRARLAAAGAVLAGFVVLARPEPSVLRAAVMGAVGLVGLAAGRPGRGTAPLLAAVVVLLAADPWLAREFGFALSVLATAALVLLAGGWTEWLRERGLPRWLAASLAVPAAAQAAVGPLAVLLRPETNLLAVPVNALAAPAVAPATVLGLLVAVVAPWWEGGAAALARVAGLATWWIAALARVAARVPTVVPLPGGAAGAALLAATTVASLVALAAVPGVRRRLRGRTAGGTRHVRP
ncbi:hypothetical protein NUM3379_20970 [Kineococcus sp. NUM-3379]